MPNALTQFPRFEKERHLKALSEDKFRDQLVRPLFYRLGYERGDDLCGPTEKGKDALFTEANKLGSTNYIVVQTKKGNLNLASKASQNITNAVAQLRTAIETPIPVLATKQNIHPTEVLLIASGKINDSGREYIATQLKNDARLRFFDSDDLIPLIDSHYPEFWASINADIIPYLKALKEMVEGRDYIGRGNDPALDIFKGAAVGKGYVSLKLFRTKQEIRRIRGTTEKRPTFEETTFNNVIKKKNLNRVLLVGDAGSGKSTALLRFAYDTAKSGPKSATDYIIPIFLRASEFSRQENIDLLDYANKATSSLLGSKQTCFTAEDLEAGRVVILLDGLDEVADNTKREQIIESSEESLKHYPNVKLIVTSRPYTFLSKISSLSSYIRYDISPISILQAEKILKNARKSQPLQQSEPKELLRRIDAVHGIELNPLLVTVFAATAEYSRQDKPANKTELFKKYTELMLGRWDETKGLGQQYHAPLKDFLLQRVAFKLHDSRTTSISRSCFEEIVQEELISRGHEVDYQNIVEELYRSDLFRVFDHRLEFRHLLLQEFFAGRGIPATEKIEQKVTDDWWTRAIVFYFGEKPDNIKQLKEIADAIGKDSTNIDNVFCAASTIGLALQACYLSQVKEKVDVWKDVAIALAVANNAVLSGDVDFRYPMSEFVFRYLISRDSVALSHVGDAHEELVSWAAENGNSFGHDDSLLFWVVTALLETGHIHEAFEVVKNGTITEPKYLLGIHMSCHLAIEVRYLEREQRDVALELREYVQRKIEPQIKQLVGEFGSQLLEVRKGNVEALDTEEGSEN